MSNAKPQTGPIPIQTVFLDRDGVINLKKPEGEYVTSWEEFVVLPGVPAAIRRLNNAGLRVIVVSNQRCIALGLCTQAAVEDIHSRFEELLEAAGGHIDRFYLCAHDVGKCDCRKPDIGLFRQAAADFPSIRAESSIMIGDSLSDMEFGHRVQMRTIFVKGDPRTRNVGMERGQGMADAVCESLSEAVEIVLNGALK